MPTDTKTDPTTGHSKLPWRLDGLDMRACIRCQSNFHPRIEGSVDLSDRRNLALIVRAVNEREGDRRTIAALVEALRNLAAEVGGVLGMDEPAIRCAIGHTNMAVLRLRLTEADAALALAAP